MPSPHRSARILSAALLLPALVGCGISIDKPAPLSKTASPDAPAPGPSGTGHGMSLKDAVAELKVEAESRDGYEREKFEHWTDEDGDGCDAREEVLLEEAVEAPEQGQDCDLTGGSWESLYDGEVVFDSSDLDIDHMVPLAEAWDSGASEWSTVRREVYANDLGTPRSLIAVTASTNRSKSDQDPAEWLPPAGKAHCTYTADWVATKLRWGLAVDQDEQAALEDLAENCPEVRVEYASAP